MSARPPAIDRHNRAAGRLNPPRFARERGPGQPTRQRGAIQPASWPPSPSMPLARRRLSVSCSALARRFLISSAVRNPMRYWASSAVRAPGSTPRISRIVLPCRPSNCRITLRSGTKRPVREAFTRTATPPTVPPRAWMGVRQLGQRTGHRGHIIDQRIARSGPHRTRELRPFGKPLHRIGTRVPDPRSLYDAVVRAADQGSRTSNEDIQQPNLMSTSMSGGMSRAPLAVPIMPPHRYCLTVDIVPAPQARKSSPPAPAYPPPPPQTRCICVHLCVSAFICVKLFLRCPPSPNGAADRPPDNAAPAVSVQLSRTAPSALASREHLSSPTPPRPPVQSRVRPGPSSRH
jgi:hypothetical protein